MPLHKSKKSGSVAAPIIVDAPQDGFGAQVTDVVFFDEQGTEVTPTDGSYLIQWTANGRDWVDFEGTFFPAKVTQAVEDWQASGYIEKIRAVPIGIVGAVDWEISFRFHGIGMPGLTARSQSSNRYFSASNTVQVSGFEQSILQGNAISSATKIFVPAGESYSVRLIRNCNTVSAYAHAEGLFISFFEGDTTGNLVDLGGGGRLNTLEDFQFEAALEIYDGPASGERIVTDKDKLDVAFIINGGGALELNNLTDSDITTFLTVGEAALSEPILPYMLERITQLEPNTEMSTYNGAN